jgi:hypothetical protein
VHGQGSAQGKETILTGGVHLSVGGREKGNTLSGFVSGWAVGSFSDWAEWFPTAFSYFPFLFSFSFLIF